MHDGVVCEGVWGRELPERAGRALDMGPRLGEVGEIREIGGYICVEIGEML